MKTAASLFLAVSRARTLISAGSHPGAAFERASREYGADRDTVRRLVHRAEAGCAFAREQLARESVMQKMVAKK